MWWWTYEWWGPWLALMAIGMILCFAFMALMARGSGQGMGMSRMCGFGRWGFGRDDPNSIVDEWLARGDIDVDEHRKLSAALTGARTSYVSNDKA